MSQNIHRIRLLASVAGPSFSYNRGTVLHVGEQIDAKEAALWVRGGRAAIVDDDEPETATAEPDVETATRPSPGRRRRRGGIKKESSNS